MCVCVFCLVFFLMKVHQRTVLFTDSRYIIIFWCHLGAFKIKKNNFMSKKINEILASTALLFCQKLLKSYSK